MQIILLMYSGRMQSFIGLIPNDQLSIMQGIKNMIAKARELKVRRDGTGLS